MSNDLSKYMKRDIDDDFEYNHIVDIDDRKPLFRKSNKTVCTIDKPKKRYITPNEIYKQTKEQIEEMMKYRPATASEYNTRVPFDMLLPVVKYFDTTKDVVNFMKVSKTFSTLPGYLRYNVVGDFKPDIFVNMQTQHFYTRDQYMNRRTEDSWRDIIWYPEYEQNKKMYDETKTIFKNIRYKCPDELLVLQDFKVPNGVKSLDKYCFNNANMTSIDLNGVRLFDIGSFIGSSLIRIRIPEGITEIPESCFSGCHQLTKVVLPNTLGIIYKDAFCGCYTLQNINLHEGIEEIGNGAFRNCNILNIDLSNLNLIRYTKSSFISTGIVNLVVSEGTMVIGCRAFAECKKMRKVHIASTVQEINQRAFEMTQRIYVVEAPQRFLEFFQDNVKPYVFRDTDTMDTYFNIPDNGRPYMVHMQDIIEGEQFVHRIRYTVNKLLKDKARNILRDYLPDYFFEDDDIN